jgi:D-alanyl-D-alanine dipeptidase
MPVPSPDEPVSALRQIPIYDNGEPLVPFMEACPQIVWVPQHPVFTYHRYQLARKSVVEMLCRAADRLPSGIRLAIVEGWRPLEIQRQMHAATHARLTREHPEWSPGQISRKTNRFSAPMDKRVPPPHTTGAAVDVQLVDESGAVLDFMSPYDLMDARGAKMAARNLSAEARRNRELLRSVLEGPDGSGLTNYPSEWWHWSYGDQAWAYRGGHPAAFYAAIEPAELADADFRFEVRVAPGF